MTDSAMPVVLRRYMTSLSLRGHQSQQPCARGLPVVASATTHWSDVGKYQSSAHDEDSFLSQAVYGRECRSCAGPMEHTFEKFATLTLQLPSQILATSLGQSRRSRRVAPFRLPVGDA